MSQQRLTLVCQMAAHTGYAQHAIQIVRQFEKLGIYVVIRPINVTEGLTHVPIDIRSRFVMGPQPEPWELVLAPGAQPPTPGRHSVLFTMAEATDLPGAVRDAINAYDAVVVPCEWNRQNFLKAGVKPHIFVVPLGVDDAVFTYQPMTMDGPTVFAVAGRTAHGRDRKGLDAAVRAFRAAFPYDQEVWLRVKCHQDCDLKPFTDERIAVERRHLTDLEVAKWLTETTCFVTAATAEGWGLWPHQAMMVGRPVIGACYAGQAEFMGPHNSYPVHFHERFASEGFCGKWAIPDLGTMMAQMKRARWNRKEAAALGYVAHQDVRNLTWETSCAQLLAVFGVMGVLACERRPFAGPKIHHMDYTPPSAPDPIEQCKAHGWPVKKMNLETWGDLVVFNPSVVEIRDELLWYGRESKIEGSGRMHGKIFRFAENEFIPHRDFRYIHFPGLPEDAFEDPRVCPRGDGWGTAISYTRVSKECFATQEIAFCGPYEKVLDVWHPDYGFNGTNSRNATGPEKNWVWFNHEGDWHFIHWLEPMTVCKVVNGRVVETWKTHKHNPLWAHGVRHGGAPPTRIGEEFFGFCHSLLPWFQDRSRYFVSAYAFEAKPPFAMTRLANVPLLSSKDDAGECPCSCVICGGAVFKDGRWILAVGAHDDQCLRIDIPHEDVLKGMAKV